jgi:hypothetical protein
VDAHAATGVDDPLLDPRLLPIYRNPDWFLSILVEL